MAEKKFAGLTGTIENAEDVAKSYPRFFDDLKSVGIEVNNEEDR